MNKPRVAYVTCRSLPEPDPDEEPVLLALARAGVAAEPMPWDAPADWAAMDLCVPRSTWNYYLDRDAFLAWAAHVAEVSRLLNPLSVIRANTDKRYLAGLEAAGVPIVPTVFVERPSVTLDDLLDERGWDDVVIKPIVGAASHGSLRCARSDLARGRAHLTELAGAGGAMVQPYLSGVEDPGERSLIWIDGELTHAVRKAPRFAGADERVSDRAVPLPAGGAALARAALETVTESLLYARVDVVPDESGRLVLMELELTEPSLYLLQNPTALERFAQAIAREARQGPR